MTVFNVYRFTVVAIYFVAVQCLSNHVLKRATYPEILRIRHRLRDTSTRLQATENSPLDSTITRNEEEVRAAMKVDREVSDPASMLASKKSEMVTAQLFDAASLDATFLQSLTAKRSYYSIVAERLMQTLDDYQLSSSIKKSNEIALKNRMFADDSIQEQGVVKEKLVVLGTGWGSHAFLKTIDATKYDVKVISPRNYFMFTPMLAASAVGTVEFRSICEPIRNVNPFADYLEATATTVDSIRKGMKRDCLMSTSKHWLMFR